MDFSIDDDESIERLWLVVRSVRPKQETDVSRATWLQARSDLFFLSDSSYWWPLSFKLKTRIKMISFRFRLNQTTNYADLMWLSLGEWDSESKISYGVKVTQITKVLPRLKWSKWEKLPLSKQPHKLMCKIYQLLWLIEPRRVREVAVFAGAKTRRLRIPWFFPVDAREQLAWFTSAA